MAQRVGTGVAVFFQDHGTRRGVSGQQHAPAVSNDLYPHQNHRNVLRLNPCKTQPSPLYLSHVTADIRPIHTLHAVPIPRPCRTAKRLECLSHLIYRVRPCLIHTCHAMPMPCSDHVVLLKATVQHGRRETCCAVALR